MKRPTHRERGIFQANFYTDQKFEKLFKQFRADWNLRSNSEVLGLAVRLLFRENGYGSPEELTEMDSYLQYCDARKNRHRAA